MSVTEEVFDTSYHKFMPESTQAYYNKCYYFEGVRKVYTEFPKVYPIINKSTELVVGHVTIEKGVQPIKYDVKAPYKLGEQLTYEEREQFLARA